MHTSIYGNCCRDYTFRGARPWQSNYRAIVHAENSGSRVIAYGDGGSPTGVENLGFTDGHGNVIITRVDMYD